MQLQNVVTVQQRAMGPLPAASRRSTSTVLATTALSGACTSATSGAVQGDAEHKWTLQLATSS